MSFGNTLIIQCGILESARAISAFQPRLVLSFVELETTFPKQICSCSKEHHVYRFVDSVDGHVNGPQLEHIKHLLTIGKSWTQTEPLLIHCMAGISRSSAAAFILMCQKLPGAEQDIAEIMSQSAPNLWPNSAMVKMADELLVRKGKMLSSLIAFENNSIPSVTRGVNVFSLSGPVSMPPGWK